MKRGWPLPLTAAALAGLSTFFAWRFAGSGGAAAAGPVAWIARGSAALALGFTALIVFQSFHGRRFPSPRWVLKIALFAVVLYFVCLCLQSYRRDTALAWLAAPLALAVALLALERGSRASRLELVLVNAALIAVGAELVLRLVARVHPSPLLARPGMEAAEFVDSRRGPPGQPRGDIVWNRWGEFDAEPRPKQPGECLIVAIGDSFSVGIVPHARHFTTVAERALPGCSVYNMGVVEIGPREYRYLLEHEALDLKPDLIVVDLFVGNDLAGSPPEPSAGDRRLREWLDRDRLLLYAVPRRLLRWGHARSEAGALAVGTPQLDTAPRSAQPWLDDPLLEAPSFPADAYLRIEAERVELNCADRPAVYAAFFAELEQLRAAAGDVPLAFMIIPDEFQVEDWLWAEVARSHPMAGLERDRPQRAIDAWLDERKVPYVDLLPILRAAPPWSDGRQHYYHLDDSHFNARGNAVAGQALAELARRLLHR